MSLQDFAVTALATFWAWETVRYAATRYVPGAFDATRAFHPLVVAAAPVYLHGLLSGLATAAVVGLVHLVVERYLAPPSDGVAFAPRSRRGRGLPPLP